MTPNIARRRYARVSTSGQNLDRQVLALEQAGCIRMFADELSSKDASRPELAACPTRGVCRR